MIQWTTFVCAMKLMLFEDIRPLSTEKCAILKYDVAEMREEMKQKVEQADWLLLLPGSYRE